MTENQKPSPSAEQPTLSAEQRKIASELLEILEPKFAKPPHWTVGRELLIDIVVGKMEAYSHSLREQAEEWERMFHKQVDDDAKIWNDADAALIAAGVPDGTPDQLCTDRPTLADRINSLREQNERLTQQRDTALDASAEHMMENMRLRKDLKAAATQIVELSMKVRIAEDAFEMDEALKMETPAGELNALQIRKKLHEFQLAKEAALERVAEVEKILHSKSALLEWAAQVLNQHSPVSAQLLREKVKHENRKRDC
jgi:hypothetical protein